MAAIFRNHIQASSEYRSLFAHKVNSPSTFSVRKSDVQSGCRFTSLRSYDGRCKPIHTIYNLPLGCFVRISNGSLTKIVGSGYVWISNSLSLSHVLHVPILDCNLLSIIKLKKGLSCVTKFSSICVFSGIRLGED